MQIKKHEQIPLKQAIFLVQQKVKKQKQQKTVKQMSRMGKQIQYRNNIEDERLQMLKLYIKEDSQRIAKLQKVRDEHIINQLSFPQNTLGKKQIETHTYRENKSILEYTNTLAQFKKNHQLVLKQFHQQIDGLKVQLNSEIQQKKYLQIKIDQYEKTMKQLRHQINLKVPKSQQLTIIKKTENQYKTDENLKLQEFQAKILTAKIIELESLNVMLKTKLKNNEAQKQLIKMNAKEALEIVRSQIYNPQIPFLKQL